MADPTPARFSFDDAAVAELRRRIDATRYPDDVNDDDWSYGTPVAALQSMLAFWRDDFDFAAAASRLNAHPHFLLAIDGLDTHFYHVRSPHAQARPLIITHGWPGSVAEFLALIPMLITPEIYGGSPDQACHVVAPSLPGYGLSQAARLPGMSPRQVARRHAALMAELGYDRYIAQGGDWGSVVSTHTALIDPAHCAGLHLNMTVPVPPKDVADPMALVAPEEIVYLAHAQDYRDNGFGYFAQQTTRPQTLGYGLTDSPAGWCAWVAEKFYTWTDCTGADGRRAITNAVSLDDFFTNLSIYWFTNSITSASRLYREHAQAERRGDEKIVPPATPTAIAAFPHDIMTSPRQWAERFFNVVQWDAMPKGGHFAAMEQPALLAASIGRFRQHIFPA